MRTKFLLMTLCLFAVSCKPNEEQISRKAERIHDDILSVDTHCDTPMRFFRGGFDPGVRNDRGCVDFPRMKEGRLDAEFFAIFIGQGPRTPEAFEREHGRTLAIFDSIKASVARHQEIAGIALNPDDALRLKTEGKVAVFIGIENGYPIGTDITKIRHVLDLVHVYHPCIFHHDICDSSSDKGGPEHMPSASAKRWSGK